jgi:hypothetical protein
MKREKLRVGSWEIAITLQMSHGREAVLTREEMVWLLLAEAGP